VGRVSAISIAGLELFFNSTDHLPPHLHAEKPGTWEVRVFFLRDRSEMFETKWPKNGGPTKGERKDLTAQVEESRAALLAEWERKVHVKAPGAAR
jgi:hypothetical protein